jgi:hypothetical protein
MSLELDENIVCVKRVKMSLYESDLSSNKGGGCIYKVVGAEFDFLGFFNSNGKTSSFSF